MKKKILLALAALPLVLSGCSNDKNGTKYVVYCYHEHYNAEEKATSCKGCLTFKNATEIGKDILKNSGSLIDYEELRISYLDIESGSGCNHWHYILTYAV
jgi:uncharacterized lipoprotein NlpE involved in copper resistance